MTLWVMLAGLWGAFIGALTARKQGGVWLDMLHYGAIYALLFMMIGFFITLLWLRFGAA